MVIRVFFFLAPLAILWNAYNDLPASDRWETGLRGTVNVSKVTASKCILGSTTQTFSHAAKLPSLNATNTSGVGSISIKLPL